MEFVYIFGFIDYIIHFSLLNIYK